MKDARLDDPDIMGRKRAKLCKLDTPCGLYNILKQKSKAMFEEIPS